MSRQGLCMCMKMTQELKVDGGVTDSIFVNTTILLHRRKYQKALKYVGRYKKMDRYRSMIDFLFVELHPEARFFCELYYKGQGLPLRKCLTANQIKQLDEELSQALKIAYNLLCEKRCRSWKQFYKQVKSITP